MQYRDLGDTGLRCSVVGVGGHQFGGDWGQVTQQSVRGILDAARESGINLIDTAASYGTHASERLIGEAISETREDWILATKFGQVDGPDTGYAVADVRRQLSDSLQSLKTDYVDLYQFHSGPEAAFRNDALWAFLNREVEHGRIRALGLSLAHHFVENDDVSQLEVASDYGVKCVQVVYNRLVPKAAEIVLPYCEEHGLGVLGRVPLAKGILSGRYNEDHVFPDGDPRALFGKETNHDLLRRAAKIQAEEIPEGVAMTEWSIGWCLRNQAISCVVAGCRTVEQVRSNARAGESR